MVKDDRPFYFVAADVDEWFVMDGDTLRVVADTGDGDRKHRVLRLNGIDAPESHSKNPLEKEAGEAVRSWVRNWVNQMDPTASLVVSQRKPEKFGRWLGDVATNAVYLTSALLTAGLVRRYGGEKKQPWSDEELNEIIRRAKA